MKKTSPYLRWLKSEQPTLELKCEQCGDPFTTWTKRSRYCSARCKTAAWRLAKQASKEPSLCEWCREPIQPPKRRFCSDAHKSRYFKQKKKSELEPQPCWWCSAPMEARRSKRFCSRAHLEKFRWARRSGQPVSVKVTETFTVQTREYDSIPAVRGKWLAHINDYSA